MVPRRCTCRLTLKALMVCALAVSGCAQWRMPQIDPSGEHIFVPASEPADPPYREVPSPTFGPQEAGVVLCPRVTVAPVNSEVVLLAGVVGPDQYLTTNARVEWMIAPGGVGQFVEVDPSSRLNYLVLDFTRPRKITETYAIGTTSRQYLRLTRGTPTPQDDVCVQRGQTWISITSPVEGTSYVTAYSPDVLGWDGRKQGAMIHWIDAQWLFPPPSINPAGTRHTFTTTVTRQSTQAPITGYLVRYEILDGPPAGFAPQGAKVAEVPTDSLGQASVEILQEQPTPGTNRIGIQVIRPESATGQRLMLGSGATSKTWSAPQIALRKTGPAVGSMGATLTYRIELGNPGDQPADQVVLTDEIPEGLVYVSSNPPAAVAGQRLQWNVGALAAAASQCFEVNLRAERMGSFTGCAEAVAAAGLRARDCVTTTVANARVDLRVSGPTQAAVGDTVTFEITVTNVGDVTATGLTLRDEFGPGLQHAEATSPIERNLNVDLAPGQSTDLIAVEFRVTQPGQLCHNVTVTGNGGIQASKQACLTAVPAAQPPVQPPPVQQPSVQPPSVQPPAQQLPPSSPLRPSPGQQPPAQPPAKQPPAKQPPAQQPAQPPSGQPPAAQKGRIQVLVLGPTQAVNVGDTAEFQVQVSNVGTTALTNVRLAVELDPSFQAEAATDGYQQVSSRQLIWTIDSIAPGAQSTVFRIKCRCVEASLHACARVQATAADGTTDKNEACVEVRTAPTLGGQLTLTLTALHNPIALGRELTYEVRVANTGQTADHNVVLTVTLPPELAPVRLQTTGPAGLDTIEGQVVKFKPVAQLLPGEMLSYRVRVLTKQPGEVQVVAKVISQNVPELSRTETTKIFAESK